MSNPDPAEVFQVEAQELLERIEQGLLDLENDPRNEELIASVFRALHTLKGSGAMFGYDALASFTHHCETAFDRVRKGEAEATPELIGAVLSALDHMRALAEGAAASAEKEAALLSALNMSAAAPAAAAVVSSGSEKKTKRWHIRYFLPPETFVNGTNPLSLLDELRELGETQVIALAEKLPALEEIDPTACYLGWDILLVTDAPRSSVENVFIFVMDDIAIEEVEEVPAAAASSEDEVVNVPPAPPADENVAAAEAGTKKDGRAAKSIGSLRVPAERLDELMDRVAELVIAQSRLKQVSAGSNDLNLRSVAEEIERLASELRDSMMFVRMVPIAQLFGRFRRLVHDLAGDLGKEIEFQTEGETTELDKTVIERLADPLVHLIRNSADHGLGSPQERLAAGKSETGHIHLAARQAGAEVVITVSDDGRGINRDRVRAKAEANGLITADAKLSDAELLQLIFKPGFSTASKVTNLSGRGVGMDVVKRTIEGLRGTIDITSEEGQGSQVNLRIPLTLAIIDGLLVRVGANRYVIPLSSVEECVELTPEQDLRSSGRSFLTLRDMLVPFIRLREIFNTGTPPDPYQKIVVVSTGAERVGLVVDQIVGQHQTVIKPMSRFHAHVETLSGATILGDGSVALILDVAHLVSAGQQQEERQRAAG